MENVISNAILNSIPTVGISGILALVIFHFYRKDTKEHMTRYEELMHRFELLANDFKTVIQDNTRAIVTISERIRDREN